MKMVKKPIAMPTEARDSRVPIKAKRAKALPMLDKEIDWASGGLVDESVPAAAEALIHGFHGQFGNEFLAWFKQRIGLYRAYRDMDGEMPAPHEELRLVREAHLYLLEIGQRLANLPPAADASINAACWRRHSRLFHAEGGLLGDFERFTAETVTLLAITEQELENVPVKRGRKAVHNRDNLLTDIAGYVIDNSKAKITKRKAAEVAMNLLTAAGIKAPDDIFEVEKLIQRQKKGRKSL